MNRPVYEIIKISPSKVFIVGISYPWISQGIEAVYEELKARFPNKRIIYTDGIILDKAYWYEKHWYEILQYGSGESPENKGQIEFTIYSGKIPYIKGWSKMLNSPVIAKGG